MEWVWRSPWYGEVIPCHTYGMTSPYLATTSLKQLAIDNLNSFQHTAPESGENHIIRVGGRLHNSDIIFNQKHPIILQEKSRITKLIIKSEHLRQLHAGPLALLAAIRLRYWPINGRKVVRSVYHECITCFNIKPKFSEQIMGNLPLQHCQPTCRFLNVDIDYGGLISILTSHRHGAKSCKGYVAVFICLCTKAIHLELVQELTTNAFMAAFQRFISQKGKPKEVCSDNVKTFVGARNELQELYDIHSSPTNPETISSVYSLENIKWNFIPPRFPHFVGLLKAGVKSFKYHLVCIAGFINL
ncbi:uncharacterized protein LOC142333378 [Lycorma delicatula]|uniref:uncharacterized protein LOC142333378 n=1 Tax=Lycorma delicatula TaxID=130591 RepID=UPI003F514E10